ncbi:TIGR01777 family oxidoreductase [Marinomonas sp. THO17]|uniref:TIGR01777 family oxidoreductase n=1 Tax=Marinomonas sp. THO17 TaxID=3149048 RepID=UPI00336BDDC3
MNILITGATGFIGQSLLEELISPNANIYALVRKKSKKLSDQVKQIDFSALSQLDFTFDVFINLAGENIAAKRWTRKRKEALINSRVNLTHRVFDLLHQVPKTIISMSAVGFYGPSNQMDLDENSPTQPGFAHELCDLWEQAVTSHTNDETRLVILRLGVVLGDGGALAKLRLPFRLGLGGPIGSGKQWFNWVHIEDVKKCILNAMEDPNFRGIYNLVAPNNVTQEEFAKQYAKGLNRPSILWTPSFVLQMIFGEMSTLLTLGPKVLPSHLQQQGYEFIYPDLVPALENIEASHNAYQQELNLK